MLSLRDCPSTKKSDIKFCIICCRRSNMGGAVSSHGSSLHKFILTNHAERQRDHCLLQRLRSLKLIRYHPSCWSRYRARTRQIIVATLEKADEAAPAIRALHKIAYTTVMKLIYDEIIGKERSIYLHELNLQYRTVLYTLNETEPLPLDDWTYDLRGQLCKDLGQKIQIEKLNDSNMQLIYKKGVENARDKIIDTEVSWTYTYLKNILLVN